MKLWKLVNLWERTIYGQFNSFPLLLSLVSTCVWKGYGWVSPTLVGSLTVNKLFLWARLWFSRLALTRWADLPHSGACISHMSKSCFPIVLLVLKLTILFPVAWLFCVSLTWFRGQVADIEWYKPQGELYVFGRKQFPSTIDGWQPFRVEFPVTDHCS